VALAYGSERMSDLIMLNNAESGAGWAVPRPPFSAYVIEEETEEESDEDSEVDIAPNDMPVGVLEDDVAKCSSRSEKSSHRSFCHASPSARDSKVSKNQAIRGGYVCALPLTRWQCYVHVRFQHGDSEAAAVAHEVSRQFSPERQASRAHLYASAAFPNTPRRTSGLRYSRSPSLRLPVDSLGPSCLE
jgi:hypothetical protein